MLLPMLPYFSLLEQDNYFFLLKIKNNDKFIIKFYSVFGKFMKLSLIIYTPLNPILLSLKKNMKNILKIIKLKKNIKL